MTFWILLTDEEKRAFGWTGWNTPLDDEEEKKERLTLRQWTEEANNLLRRKRDENQRKRIGADDRVG